MLFLAIRERLDQRDEGFTLIETLIVVIIIGILVAIAVPAFVNQRERARRADLQSDLRNAAVEAEMYFTEESTYKNFTLPPSFRESDGVTITVERANATGFCLQGTHAGLPAGEVWSYDSDGPRQNPPTAQLSDKAC